MNYTEDAILLGIISLIGWWIRRLIVNAEKKRKETHEQTIKNKQEIEPLKKDIEYMRTPNMN